MKGSRCGIIHRLAWYFSCPCIPVETYLRLLVLHTNSVLQGTYRQLMCFGLDTVKVICRANICGKQVIRAAIGQACVSLSCHKKHQSGKTTQSVRQSGCCLSGLKKQNHVQTPPPPSQCHGCVYKKIHIYPHFSK